MFNFFKDRNRHVVKSSTDESCIDDNILNVRSDFLQLPMNFFVTRCLQDINFVPVARV